MKLGRTVMFSSSRKNEENKGIIKFIPTSKQDTLNSNLEFSEHPNKTP